MWEFTEFDLHFFFIFDTSAFPQAFPVYPRLSNDALVRWSCSTRLFLFSFIQLCLLSPSSLFHSILSVLEPFEGLSFQLISARKMKRACRRGRREKSARLFDAVIREALLVFPMQPLILFDLPTTYAKIAGGKHL